MSTEGLPETGRLTGIRRLCPWAGQFLELWALDRVPLPDEDFAVVIADNLGMPGQARVTCMDLVGLVIDIEAARSTHPTGASNVVSRRSFGYMTTKTSGSSELRRVSAWQTFLASLK